jgi:outer membrane receptor protein involved in Fe transport
VQLPSLNNLGGFLLAIPPFGYAGGNPDVIPSVVTSYEVGWDRNLSALGADLRVSLYQSRARDLVAFLGGSDFEVGLLSTSANVGDSKTTGLEVSIDAPAGPNWSWGATYAYQTIRDRLRAGFSVGNTFVNFEDTLPRHVLQGRLGWTHGPWEIDGRLRYQSEADGVAAAGPGSGQLVSIPAWVAVDGRLAYRVTPRATLAVAVETLNRATQRRTSASEIERSVVASLTVEF